MAGDDLRQQTDEQPPPPCPDPWCEGTVGHADCVGERMVYAMRHVTGVSMGEIDDVSGRG